MCARLFLCLCASVAVLKCVCMFLYVEESDSIAYHMCGEDMNEMLRRLPSEQFLLTVGVTSLMNDKNNGSKCL
jgi:hypothetical protein